MTARHPIAAVAIPDESRVRHAYPATNLADAYEARLPGAPSTIPKHWPDSSSPASPDGYRD